jgi:glycosyltransferase involved in cell wall biosynthesis
MRILFCNYEYPPLGGGGGVVMAALARHLARRHQVTVLTSQGPGLPAQEDDAGVEVIRVPVFFRRDLAVANFPSMLAYLPSGFARGVGLRRSHRFDVVNTHFAVPSGPLGHALARLYRVPNVLSVHGGDLFDPSKASSPHRHAIFRAAVRSLLRSADTVVGQSHDTLRHVGSLYGVKRQVELIPLGIERPVPARDPRRAAFGIPDDAFTMITIGRLVARKATAQLLEMMRDARLAKAHLLVVGDGPEAPELHRLSADPAIRDRVHWLGAVSEEVKQAALAVSDLFVSASQHEGFGLVYLEAMAASLPIVCYDRGGQVDFLASGQTGYVVGLNERKAFTQAVAVLQSDASIRERFAHENRRRVEQFFIDTCAARYEALFAEAIERRGRERGPVLRATTPN